MSPLIIILGFFVVAIYGEQFVNGICSLFERDRW